MRFLDYARLNGACSAAIGVAFIAAGFPGLLAPAWSWWLAIPGVLVVLVPLAIVAHRRQIPVREPGRWLTERAMTGASLGRTPLDAQRLRVRLIGETVLWGALAVAVFLGFTTSRPFAYLTGWASLAYGLLELVGSAARIRAVEAEKGVLLLVWRRPGIGTPSVTYTRAGGSRGTQAGTAAQ